MWPITAAELVRACGGEARLDGLEGLAIAAVTVGDLPPAAGQVYVPVQEDVDGHQLVRRALERGVSLAIVCASWPGLSELEPGLRRRCVVVADALAAFRALAAHLRRRFDFPVIAIAGSNGKTTTKELTAALLAAAGRRVSKTPETMNGFTGLPFSLCQRQHATSAPPSALVLEIGVDAVGAMAEHARLAAPDVVAITALDAEHLAGFGSAEAAAAEELVLFTQPRARRVWQLADARLARAFADPATGARAGDVVVCREDVGEVAAGVSVLRYAIACASPRALEIAIDWRPAPGAAPETAPWRGRCAVALGGAHNAANLALAFATALAVGVEAAALCPSGSLAFAAPRMRCQVETLAGGMVLVDDAYNASPASLRAALELVEAPLWRRRPKRLVLGDMLDLGAESARYHRELAAAIDPARVVAVGAAMRAALAGARGCDADAPAEEIVDRLAPTADAVILVKGSRGLRLERVSARLRSAPPAAPGRPDVAVAGQDAARAARLVGAALGRHGAADVVALPLGALATAPRSRAVVITRFALDAAFAAPAGAPQAEHQLALLAQPLLRLAPGAHAILDADDEASALLALAVPPGVSVTRYGTGAAADVRGTLAGGVLSVGSLAIALEDESLARAALAALALATALAALDGGAAVEAIAQALLELKVCR
jgi:UDP-N-acetylmuramoyl-tripeptide--D-alanyl-D-alanine ligase